MSESVVYFLEAEGTSLVKIGYSSNLDDRLRDLRTASPVSLHLLCTEPGGPEREELFHRLLAPLRDHGEWFYLPPDLRSRIARSGLSVASRLSLIEETVDELRSHMKKIAKGGEL